MARKQRGLGWSMKNDRTNRQMNRKSGAARSLSAQSFTEKQGQYLAFIYTYSHMFRRPPAETDMQRHFQVSPPSIHQMIVTLERNGLIRRQPRVARSIQILVAPEDLPILVGQRRDFITLLGGVSPLRPARCSRSAFGVSRRVDRGSAESSGPAGPRRGVRRGLRELKLTRRRTCGPS